LSNSFAKLYFVESGNADVRRLLWHVLSIGSVTLDEPDHHQAFDKAGVHLFWVRAGSGTMKLDEGESDLKPGSRVWMVDLRKPRTYIPAPDAKLTTVGFRFAGPGLENWLDTLSRRIVFPLDAAGAEAIHVAQRKLLALVKRRPAGYEWQAHLIITRVLGLLLRASDVLNSNPQATPAPVARVLNAVLANPAKDWRVRELAAIAGISYSGLRQLFQRTQQESAHQFLQRTRLDQARQLLGDRRLSVKQVAERLNFSSEFYFSHFFRKANGNSPSQFRQHHETGGAVRPAPRKEPVGIIGLGLMGHAFAQRLLAAGFPVAGFDIAPACNTAARRLGVEIARDASAVFKRCRRVLLSLPTLAHVRDVLRRSDAALTRGHILLDTTTGSPEEAESLGTTLAARGVAYLDATISGNSTQVAAGEVLGMVGGPHRAFEQCADLFATFTRRTLHVGNVGDGARLKLVTNLVLGLNRASLAEGLVFAERLGFPRARALAVLIESMAYSRVMHVKGRKMVEEDFVPQARLSQHLKDVRVMRDVAKRLNLSLPFTEAHTAVLESAEAAGLGALDNSAIIRAIAGLNGNGNGANGSVASRRVRKKAAARSAAPAPR